MDIRSTVIGGRWRTMMSQGRRVQVKQKGVSELEMSGGAGVRSRLTRLKPAPTSRRRLWCQRYALESEQSQAYVLSSPFAKPPHTSPAHTLRNTCQQAFPISIPPAQCPHLLNSLPYIVSCSQGDPSSVGHRFATWRMTTEKSSQALIRQKSPGRRRYLGVSGDIRNLETGHQP